MARDFTLRVTSTRTSAALTNLLICLVLRRAERLLRCSPDDVYQLYTSHPFFGKTNVYALSPHRLSIPQTLSSHSRPAPYLRPAIEKRVLPAHGLAFSVPKKVPSSTFQCTSVRGGPPIPPQPPIPPPIQVLRHTPLRPRPR